VLRRTILIATGVVLLLVGAVSASGHSATETITVQVNTAGVTTKTELDKGTKLTISGELTDTTPFSEGCRYDAFYTEPCNTGVTTHTLAQNVSMRAKASQGPESGFLHYIDFVIESVPAYRADHVYTVVVREPMGATLFCVLSCGSGTNRLTGSYQVAIEGVPPPPPCPAQKAAAECHTKTVDLPAPGKSAQADSPATPAKCDGTCKIDVYDETYDSTSATRYSTYLSHSAIGTEGDLERLKGKLGEFILWCWVTYEFRDEGGVVHPLTPHYQLLVCINLAVYLIKTGALGSPKPAPARATAAVEGGAVRRGDGCTEKAIPIVLHKRRGKYVLGGRAKKAKLSASSTRYGCTVSNGTVTLAATAPRGLRKAVGKTLTVGLYPSPDAPAASGKVGMQFGW
jgi:hypothetical protein